MSKIDTLQTRLQSVLGDKLKSVKLAKGELTATVSAGDYLEVMRTLRDHPELAFEQMIDLCGVDYSTYGDGRYEGPRYAVVVHLLSVSQNWRLRVRCFCPDDEWPVMPSINDIWNAANWYEREAFDLFGIIFEGHLDLRRIST